jgi:uncharacterized protein GlcG (DUF336 family)
MKTKTAWVLALLAILTAAQLGCSQNPTLSSAGYQQALALLNTCSRQDPSALARLETAFIKAKKAAELNSDEIAVLEEMIEKAKQGKWEAVGARVRTLLEKQARTGLNRADPQSSGQRPQRHSH